ncbi:hypothetical protein Vafri_3246 [Volvox africanus]|uniref:NF-kappa-B inhibitor-like protein 1 n=1 Tax=Volvox africanus TaxID=51714 RepID=A0A8J4ASQ2_9CHLO|nr:hypothetical protein Vafri_3246 [Volvox africanus]
MGMRKDEKELQPRARASGSNSSQSPSRLQCHTHGRRKRSRGSQQLRFQQPDLTAVDSQGRTLLHKACACGHASVVKLLLRYGAQPAAVDALGDTPAHVAASTGHLEALAEVLQAQSAPPLEAAGAGGATLRDLMGRALRDDEAAGEVRMQPPEEAAPHGRSGARGSGEGEESEDEETRWRRRLREEYSGGEEAVSDSYVDVYGGLPFVGESDDEWADRIWREMQARRNTAVTEGAAAFIADLRADAARRAAAAAEHSRRILEEEQAKDDAWRRRTLAAIEAVPATPTLDVTLARASYDERWLQLDEEAATAAADLMPLHYSDIPWPLEPPTMRGQVRGSGGVPERPPLPPSVESLRDFFLLGAAGASDVKRRLRIELLRWHPDKFGARFGSRLAAGGMAQRDAVLSRVHQLAQVLMQVLGRGASGTNTRVY